MKKTFIIILMLCLLATVGGCSNSSGSTAASQFKSVVEGEIISFGHYEQDGDTSNGSEIIEWIVLTKEKGKILLISRYALDCYPFNETDGDVTWETCDLREWLNNVFYNSAFDSSEQKVIATTTVKADKNPEYSSDCGKDTKDKVFVLSVDEAMKYFSDDDERICAPTYYALQNGVHLVDLGVGTPEFCRWWLRNSGEFNSKATVVINTGTIGTRGLPVYQDDLGIRPVIWVNI